MGRARRMALVAAALLVAAIAVTACAPAGGDVTNAEFKRLQASGVRVIDVRTAAEYADGYIPGAENVPIDQLATAAASWDKTQPIALYCATGSRSAEGMQILKSMGFTKVYNLATGIVAWDGEVVGGTTAGAPPAEPSASGLPVMYEFYTDW